MVDIYKGSNTEEYLKFYRDKPQEILIETVGPCNLRCIGCPQTLKEYQQKKWKPAFMDLNLFEDIITQAKNLWEPINVGLYHTGEITLMPNDRFNQVLMMAKYWLNDDAGWDSVGFYTNGLEIDSFKCRSIIDSGINWVRLSFDGGDKESYESVRIGSNFDRVYSNAIMLAEMAKSSGRKIRLEVIFVPYRENEQSIPKFQSIWEGTGWSASCGGTMNYGGLMEDAVKDRRHVRQGKVRSRHSIPCPRVFEQFTVLVDGKVSLCSADPMGQQVLGDLTKQSIKEVFYGSKRSEILKLHILKREHALKPCDVCDYTEYCGTPKHEFFGERPS